MRVGVRFGGLAVGDELPPLARVVTREDVKAYANAGGDQNPLHQDDAFARSVGFDGIIAHGMFTMGQMAQCLVDWLGDPAPIRRLKAQFRAPVFPGDVLTAGGKVRSLEQGTRTAVIDLWVTAQRDGSVEYPIRRGEAEVRFSGGE